MASRWSCFAVCAPGLEALVADELAALGVRPRPRMVRGGVEFAATTRLLYAAHLHLAMATRVLVRVGRFTARTWADLEIGLGRVDWAAFFAPGAGVAVRVTASGAGALHHTGAIAERVALALDRPVDAEGATVFVRVAHDVVTVSVDGTGERLDRRGWRLATAKAPLRPTLAAALLACAGWDGTTPLADPMAGSGTIAIEAALRARRIPPGWARDFAFQRWPSFEPGTWASVRGAAQAAMRPSTPAPIVAADRDAGAMAATRANAERAGVADDVEVRHAPLSALRLERTGLVATNPPYGSRVRGGGDLRNLYATLGRVSAGGPLALVAADDALAAATGRALVERARTSNGGLPVHLLVSG